MNDDVKNWLRKAEEDIITAEVCLKNNRLEAAAFFSQQAAEKALKFLYITKFKRLWKVHDLKILGEKVGASEEILELCDSLNPAYVETRYPLNAEYDEEMAGEALNNARKVIKWVKEKSTNA